MAIKLIALDIDGTLINSAMEITQGTVCALTAAAERGIHIVLSTGRPAMECDHILEKLSCIGYINSCTGAQVVNAKTWDVIAGRYIPIDEAKRLYEKIRELPLMVCAFDPKTGQAHDSAPVLARCISHSPPHEAEHLLRYHVGEDDFEAYLDNLDRIVKFYMPCFTIETIEEVKRRMIGEPYTVFQCGPKDVEICPVGADKGSGLQMLAEALGINPSEVMAIGDSENDISMLRYAGLPVAMGNGSEEVKALAKYITDDNDHDGVAKAVNMVLEGTL